MPRQWNHKELQEEDDADEEKADAIFGRDEDELRESQVVSKKMKQVDILITFLKWIIYNF